MFGKKTCTCTMLKKLNILWKLFFLLWYFLPVGPLLHLLDQHLEMIFTSLRFLLLKLIKWSFKNINTWTVWSFIHVYFLRNRTENDCEAVCKGKYNYDLLCGDEPFWLTWALWFRIRLQLWNTKCEANFVLSLPSVQILN